MSNPAKAFHTSAKKEHSDAATMSKALLPTKHHEFLAENLTAITPHVPAPHFAISLIPTSPSVISSPLIMNPTGVLFIRQAGGERGHRAGADPATLSPHRGSGTGILIGEQHGQAGQSWRHTVHANLC